MTNKGLKKHACPGGVRGEESPVFEIIETDLKLPSKHKEHDIEAFVWNDTIIKNVENEEVYFIRKRFLKICGPLKITVSRKELLSLVSKVRSTCKSAYEICNKFFDKKSKNKSEE